jgi:hypothetical protein
MVDESIEWIEKAFKIAYRQNNSTPLINCFNFYFLKSKYKKWLKKQ